MLLLYMHGVLGQWVSPATKRAMEVYMEIVGGGSEFFLDPALDTATHVQVNSALRTFQRMYLEDFGTMLTATLIRKNLHTVIAKRSDIDRCIAFLCRSRWTCRFTPPIQTEIQHIGIYAHRY